MGRQFARDLQRPDLWQRPFHLRWLALVGAMYLMAIGISTLFWYRLLLRVWPASLLCRRAEGMVRQPPGKYLPGKAGPYLCAPGCPRHWGPAGGRRPDLRLRGSDDHDHRRPASRVLFGFLGPETTAGIDWATLMRLFTLQLPDQPILDRRLLVLLALILLFPLSVAVTPPVFNRLMYWLAQPFRRDDAVPSPASA